MAMKKKKSKHNRYQAIIAKIFKANYKKGAKEVFFERDEIEDAAKTLGIKLPKNLGDLIYTFRFRTEFPVEIKKFAPKGKTWTIELAGRAKYKFSLTSASTARLLPRTDLAFVKIPDATPEIISRYALTDEQALLAKLRYNRLIDIFLGIAAYSLQSHMRTTAKSLGGSQIEIDEVYVGVNKIGQQFIVPVQAKGGSDQLGGPQMRQDIAWSRERFPNLICRVVCAQFINNGETIALFELTEQNGDLKVVEEKHYRLVPANSITDKELQALISRS